MSKFLKQFGFFLKRNRYILLLLSVFTFLIHGDKLFSTNSGIDTEKIIFEDKELYASWLGIGRQGLVLLKWILGQLHYNPYFAAVLTLVFLVGGVAVFGFLFELVQKKAVPQAAFFLFGAIVIAHPVLTEQLYFSLQGAEVTLAFILCAGSLLCAHRFATRPISAGKTDLKGKRDLTVSFVCGVLLLFPALGVYQAFAPFYLFGIVALCCLREWNTPGNKKQFAGEELRYFLKLCSIFFAGFLLNQGMTVLFFTGSDYLKKQVQWDPAQIGMGIGRILSHVRDVVLGVGVFYFGTFLWLSLVLFFLVFWHGRIRLREEEWSLGLFWWKVFLLFGVYASPFFLTFLLGERPVIRGQLVLPFTMGFMTYMSVMLAGLVCTDKKKWFQGGIIVLGLLTIWQEADITSRLYYTDAVRYQEDLWLAGNLKQDIVRFTNLCDYRGTVVFAGKRKAPGNCATITGDVMGQSLFAWDTGVEPENFWSSSRIIGFMHCMGTNYQKPTREQTMLATECARDMPCYPAEGSLGWCQGMVVVKLSGE